MKSRRFFFCNFSIFAAIICTLCILLSRGLSFERAKKTSDAAVQNEVRRKIPYARLSIHNRNLSNLLKLFHPYDIKAELRKANLKILEIGCGEGNTLLEIVEENPSLEATCLSGCETKHSPAPFNPVIYGNGSIVRLLTAMT